MSISDGMPTTNVRHWVSSVNEDIVATLARSCRAKGWKHSIFEDIGIEEIVEEEDLSSVGRIRWRATRFHLVFPTGAKQWREGTNIALLLIRRKRCQRQWKRRIIVPWKLGSCELVLACNESTLNTNLSICRMRALEDINKIVPHVLYVYASIVAFRPFCKFINCVLVGTGARNGAT